MSVKATFLFGAGASRPACCPIVTEIDQWLTDEISNEESLGGYAHWLLPLWAFIRRIADKYAISQYNFSSNYETLLWFLKSLDDNATYLYFLQQAPHIDAEDLRATTQPPGQADVKFNAGHSVPLKEDKELT